jgi:hypothetical protein
MARKRRVGTVSGRPTLGVGKKAKSPFATSIGSSTPAYHNSPMAIAGANIPAPAPSTPRPGLGQPAAPAPRPVVGQHAAPDSTYNRQVDTATRKGEARLGQIEGAEQHLKFDFGIDDATNPFSRAEGIKRAYLAKYKGASAGLASQGQLYSGAHERALKRTRREEEEALANLRQVFNSSMDAFGAEKAGIKFDTEEERNAAFESWLARAPAAEDLAGGAAPAAPKAGPAARPAAVPRGSAGGQPVAVGGGPQVAGGGGVAQRPIAPNMQAGSGQLGPAASPQTFRVRRTPDGKAYVHIYPDGRRVRVQSLKPGQHCENC